MTFEAQVTLYTILVFLLLLAVLWRYAWGPLMGALAEREERIARKISDAEAVGRAAEEKLKEFEQKLATAKEAAAAIIAEGKRDATRVSEEILESLDFQSAKALARAKREIQMAKEAAVHDVRQQMVRFTAELAAKVISREVRPEDHRRLIEEALAEAQKTVK
jgi:F-type H+-transporting ATPase subunit b